MVLVLDTADLNLYFEVLHWLFHELVPTINRGDRSIRDLDVTEARGKCRKDLQPLLGREYLKCQPSSCASWLLFLVAN